MSYFYFGNYFGLATDLVNPSSENACIIYEMCFGQNGYTPLSSSDVSDATVKVISLPEDLNDVSIVGKNYSGTYNSNTGELYWEVVKGAEVRISIPSQGIHLTKIIPDSSRVRILDL